MIKQYFSDGLIQIAILLSLLRTDLNNFGVPNNEILNYPEVQDILQGQTLAYLPTSFHNQYNTLNSIHGYAHPKHADNDFYFSSIFRELRRFRGVSTNIEAFLVSDDATVGLPPPNQGNVVPSSGSTSSSSSQAENVDSSSTDQAQVNVDVNHNPVCSNGDFSNPFPGLDLCKEDLDLIEVLWRQDVDLGVGKEVFDSTLRRELEHEREVELRKEQEKRKEAEKREREREQQAHLWLTQNFVRDGETGEWMPIAGTGNSNSLSPSGPSTLHPEPPSQTPLTLAEALSYNGDVHVNHTYGQQLQQQQAVVPALPSNQSHTASAGVAENFDFTAEGFMPEDDYPLPNQTNKERLEESWKDVISYLSDANNTNVVTNNTNNSTIMPPVDTHNLLPTESTITNFSQPQLHQQLQQQQQQHYHQQQLNGSFNFNMMPEQNQNVSAAASMTETRRLLRQNSTAGEVGNFSSETGMVLQNVTLPLPPALDNNLSVLLDVKPLLNDSGMSCQDYNATNPMQDALSPLDWENGELFFPNITDLANNMSAPLDSLDPSDILTELLPNQDLDMAIDEGLGNIQMLDDGGSDSAISMGSGSPQQEVNETMAMSPFDGLEGATGGSDYESSNYGHHRSHTQSSGSAEDDGFHYSCSSYGSPASVNTNCSTGSNDTEHASSHSSTSLNHIHHNHTYPTQPGQTPREVKKYAKKDGPRQKGPQSRDAKRAEDLKLPYSFERIVECPVEEFNDLVTKTKLTEAQIALMRDIRRRGKNKVAAQNCRKRKLDVLVTLEDEMQDMETARDKLAEERRQIDLQTRQTKEKYAALYDHIFRSLRDEHGQPYNPDEFSLQQSSDGNVFLVRLTNASATTSLMSSSQQRTSPPSGSSRKSKGYGPQKKKSKE